VSEKFAAHVAIDDICGLRVLLFLFLNICGCKMPEGQKTALATSVCQLLLADCLERQLLECPDGSQLMLAMMADFTSRAGI
jgi:hypothetical protein